MSEPPEEKVAARLRDTGELGPPRLVHTPAWVRPFGAVLVVGLVALSVLAAIGSNPW